MKLHTRYLLSIAAALLPALSMAQSCDVTQHALGFEVRAVDSGVVEVQTDASSREMNRRSKRGAFGGKLLGQTDAQFGARLVTEDRECGRKVVVLEAHLVKQVVHVASDLPKDSCTFRETYEHELEHVGINRGVLAAAQAELPAKLDATRYASAADLQKAVMADVVPALYKRFTDSVKLHNSYDDHDKQEVRSAECARDLARQTAAL